MNHELILRLEQLAARLAATTEHHGYAHMVIEAAEELRTTSQSKPKDDTASPTNTELLWDAAPLSREEIEDVCNSITEENGWTTSEISKWQAICFMARASLSMKADLRPKNEMLQKAIEQIARLEERQQHEEWCDLRRPEWTGECTCSSGDRQLDDMRHALAIDGSTASNARRLADEIEREGVERTVYGKSHSELVSMNWAIVAALREYAMIGVGQRIMDSADAQYFRWLLENHSGSEVLGTASRCWIGGVEFTGEDVRDAIDGKIEAKRRNVGTSE